MAPTGGNGFRRRWAALTEAIASRLWPIPLAAVIVDVGSESPSPRDVAWIEGVPAVVVLETGGSA